MKAVVHVIPCAGILKAAAEAREARTNVGTIAASAGLAHMALSTAERLEAPADLVLLAVPAGTGHDVAAKLIQSNRPPKPKRPARYTNETDEQRAEDLGQLAAEPPEPRR